MKKKIIILIAVIILLIIGGFMLYGYLGGFPVGFHNGRLVIRRYFCSDVCPQYGYWHEEYFGVNNKKDCEQLGGLSIIDPAWGGFVGCAPNQQKEITEPSKIIFPTSKLVYNSKGKAKIYDFRNSKEIDLGLSGVTGFLWSKNGQLATLVQGKYGGDQGFLGIPRVFATTEGFNYLLYLVDLEGKKPKLILPEVFGEVFWSEDSTGFYVSENYRADKPILLGEQSGLQQNEIKTFFVTLDGAKKPIDKKVFDRAATKSLERVSPDNKFYIKSGGIINFEKIIEMETTREYTLKPETYYTMTFNAKWSPNGERVAFLYRVSEEATKNSILNTATLNEVLTQSFSDKLKGSLPSAESVDFDWIDNRLIIVSKLNYISQPGHYQGNIGIL